MNRLKFGPSSSWIAVFAGRSLCWASLWSFHNIGHVLFWMWSLTWNCHKNPSTVHHRADVQNGSTETASLVYLKRPCRASVSVWWWFVSCFSESLVTLIVRDEIKTYLCGTFLDYLTQHFWVKLSNTKLSLHSEKSKGLVAQWLSLHEQYSQTKAIRAWKLRQEKQQRQWKLHSITVWERHTAEVTERKDTLCSKQTNTQRKLWTFHRNISTLKCVPQRGVSSRWPLWWWHSKHHHTLLSYSLETRNEVNGNKNSDYTSHESVVPESSRI